jgi:capsular polysaccharide biosynthesis protein
MYPDNYYHFLIEALPSIISLLASEDLNEHSVIVSGKLHSNMLSAFNFVTFPMRISLLQLSELRYVTADEVVVTPDSAYGAHLTKGGISDKFVFNKDNLRELRYFFKASKHYYTGMASRRLFVRRRSSRRDLTNSHSLEMIAKSHGFEIIDPGELSFFDQVTLFSSASIVCGPTGAWIANMLFSASNTEYIIYYPNTYQPIQSLWSGLGEVLNIKVTDIYCPISSLNSDYPIHSDFTVPEHAFEQLLTNRGY